MHWFKIKLKPTNAEKLFVIHRNEEDDDQEQLVTTVEEKRKEIRRIQTITRETSKGDPSTDSLSHGVYILACWSDLQAQYFSTNEEYEYA